VLHFNVMPAGNNSINTLFLISLIDGCMHEALMEHPGGEYIEPFKFPERRDDYSLIFKREGDAARDCFSRPVS
jgi:hypothetical protein